MYCQIMQVVAGVSYPAMQELSYFLQEKSNTKM